MHAKFFLLMSFFLHFHSSTCFLARIPRARNSQSVCSIPRVDSASARIDSIALSSSYLDSLSPPPPPDSIPSLKIALFSAVSTLRSRQLLDGQFSVDFGVSGGELDSKTRAPKKLNFYDISDGVGKAADVVFDLVDRLASVNPTASATAGWGTPESPLRGRWELLFSTAADATFSKGSRRGDARASNEVADKGGKITNVIDFQAAEEGGGRRRLVESLKVRLRGKAEGDNRVVLTFRYAIVQFGRFFRVPVRWRLWVPVPGPMLTKLIFAVMRRKEMPPLPYFDVLFLDDELRIHRTGEGNLFVQKRA